MFFLTIPSHFQNPEPNEKNLGSQLREFLFWKFFEEKKNISCFSFWFWKLGGTVKKQSVWMFFPLCTPGSKKEFMWYFWTKIFSRKTTLELMIWLNQTYIYCLYCIIFLGGIQSQPWVCCILLPFTFRAFLVFRLRIPGIPPYCNHWRHFHSLTTFAS